MAVATRLTASDASVVGAGLTGWHEAHESSLRALRSITRLPGHALAETAVVRSRIVGGSLYDALVGFTAGLAGAVLRTGDLRALRTYEVLGIDVEQVGS